MKHMRITWYFLPVFLLSLLACISCNDNDGNDSGRKITGYKEYCMTIASRKVLGVINVSTQYVHPNHPKNGDAFGLIYAVKQQDGDTWQPFAGGIADFEYEEGYEYRVRYSETSYLDYAMGDPAWTERELIEVISKEEKASTGLPASFLPDDKYQPVTRTIRYAIVADNSDMIEKDLFENILVPDNYRYRFNSDGSCWVLVDGDGNAAGYGSLKMEKKDLTNPHYKPLLPEEQIEYTMEWTLVNYIDIKNTVEQRYDVLLMPRGTSTVIGNSLIQQYTPWLYQDLTARYRNMFPDNNIESVIVCEIIG